MTKYEKEQALNKWFRNVCSEIQEESFKFQDSCIPFGAGLGLGVFCKHFNELEKIVFEESERM